MIRIWILTACVALPCFAQEAFQDFTMQQYLSLLEKNDVEYEKILKGLDQLEFNKDLAMPSRQFLIQVQNEYGVVLGDGQTTKTFGTTASKEIHETGTTISANYQRNELIGRDEETIGIRIEQDLLKNALGNNVRKQSKALKLENEILYLQVVQAYEDYVETKMQDFIDLQLAYLEFQAAKDLYEQSKKLEKNIKLRKRSNVAISLDVDRIVLQTLNTKEQMLSSEYAYDQKLLAVHRVLGEKIDVSTKISPWKDYLVDDSDIESLVGNTRSIKILQLREKALTEKALVERRNQYPELDLVLGLNRDEFTRFNVAANRNEAVIGFGLTMPLGDSQTRAVQKSIAFDASVAHIDQKLTKRDLQVQLETLFSELRKQQQVVEIAKQKYEIAKRISDQELKRYNRGQIQLEQYIDAQTEMAQNQYEQIQASISLQSHILRWQNLTDQLVQKELQGKN